MLRKRISRWTSRPEGGGQPFAAFSEPFWQYYADVLGRSTNEWKDVLPTNPRDYNKNSPAVGQVKALFPADATPSTFQVVTALKLPFSNGDVAKAYYFLRYFQLSDLGYFITNDGHDRSGAPIALVGAENWENVMCYMDALLFSMFANLESFEPILFILNQHPNALVTQLLGLLRVYVNLMRLGNLITTDISARICECLGKLGFSEAISHRQQDCAPLFEFLTETLAMPLLTFRVEIQHSGKQDDDDTKYLKERVLFVSIPDDNPEPVKAANTHVEDGSGLSSASNDDVVLLEECLEHYFNNLISVKRELQRRATMDGAQRPSVVQEGIELGVPAENSPSDSPVARPEARNAKRSDSSLSFAKATTASSNSRVQVRTRSSTLSIWSISSVESKPREVMLPAWMLLRLLPFYTDDNDIDGANESVARNSSEFANRRPVLPICLKRYSFSASDQQASRSRKRIVIPPVIDLPLFVADDSTDTSTTGFKLILESAVCHRGTTISSGHFVSAVRKNTHIVDESLELSLNAEWYLYDDLKKTRVVTKTFKEIFDKEWPYMLFYRLVRSETSGSSRATSSNSSPSASPMMAPKGHRANYWKEELSPIISETTAPTSNLAKGDSKSDKASDFGSQIYENNGSVTSIPIPDVLPSSPHFVDIRKRYFWYVTDKDKNYYKEHPSISKSGSRNMSISFTPQFRRNSQWSEMSNISGLSLEDGRKNKVDLDDVSKKLETLEDVPSDTNEKASDHGKVSDGALSPSSKSHKHHLHKIFSHEKEQPPSLAKKQLRKRRAEYKKEKCIIT